MLELRHHQQLAVNSIYSYFETGRSGHPVLEAPTSAGKSLIQADFIKSVLERWPGQRILCLAHVQELIEQNYLELVSYWADAPAGINAAGLNRRDTEAGVIFAMIQSVHKRAYELGRFDLIIIDEAHLVPVKTSEGMYRNFINDCARINPNIRIIGLSATPYRLDNGLLTEGENRLFTDIIPAKRNRMTIDDLLEAGYLAPLSTPKGGIKTRFSVEGVGKSGGDFKAGELAAAVDVDDVTQAACAELARLGYDRKSWLVFATSVKHAEHICAALHSRGVHAEMVTGTTPKSVRRRITARCISGELRCLVNVGCLTTGFNARGIDLVAFMRPTLSASLYVQMAGRGMRQSPETGKTDCLILDFAGLIDKHGPVNDVKPPKKKGKGGGDAPVKECPECYEILHASARECFNCRYKFPIDETPKINAQASASAILAGLGVPDLKQTKHEVTRATYAKHDKPGKPPSIRVDYYNGLTRVASEWVCLFHGGRAQASAEKWWRQWVGPAQYSDIDNAIDLVNQLGQSPDYIYTEKQGRYTKIISAGKNLAEGAA